MKRLKQQLDPKYTKISLYAGITFVLAVLTIIILYSFRGVLTVSWQLITSVLKPLILGCIFCYLFLPLVNFFEKKLQTLLKKDTGLRGLAVLISVFLVLAAILLILTIIVITMTKQISNIDFEMIKALFAGAADDALDLFDKINEYLSKFGINISSLGSHVSGIVSGLAGGMSTMFFGLVFSIYFLVDGRRISDYWKKVVSVVFPAKTINRFKEFGKDADHCFSGYIRGQALDALLVGSLVSIIFILIKMPYAFLIGLIIGIGNLIPYVGPILGYGAVIIINLLEYNPKMLIIGLIVMLLVMFIDGNVINPRLLAGAIEVHPLLVVASLLAGGAIGGILGMLISVPTGAFVKLQFEKWLSHRQEKKPSE